MKEIKAYTHPHRIADVVHALKSRNHATPRERLRCRNLTVVPVKVLFKTMDASEQHYSIELAEIVVNEFKLELVCEVSRRMSG